MYCAIWLWGWIVDEEMICSFPLFGDGVEWVLLQLWVAVAVIDADGLVLIATGDACDADNVIGLGLLAIATANWFSTEWLDGGGRGGPPADGNAGTIGDWNMAEKSANLSFIIKKSLIQGYFKLILKAVLP